MNILFLDQSGGLGGGQQVLLELARAAQAQAYKVMALLPRGECTVALEQMGVSVNYGQEFKLNEGKKSWLDLVKLLYVSLIQFWTHRKLFHNADILCANGGRVYLLCLLASIVYKKPAIYYVHINLSNVEYTFLRYILSCKYTKHIVTPSYFIERCLLEHSDAFNDRRVVVIENGLDSRFSHIKYMDRFSNQPIKHIGIVGRVHPLKGQDVLFPLAKKFQDLHFHILGDAASSEKEYYNNLRATAPPNICFHGWVHDLQKTVNAIPLQVCIIPSRNFNNDPKRCFEAFSLVSIEMSALSCLVVARNIGALADQVQNLQLIPFEQDEELIGIIEKILSMTAHELTSNTQYSFTKVMQNYNQQAFQQRLQDFFVSIKKIN